MAVSLAPRRSPECPGYQVMRTDQRRYFGHPDLVQFIQRLSNQVHNKGMGTVLIGDMGMPAGGRFNGGHASHQTGLDVDIFLQLPQTRWTSSQLLKPQALDWSPAMASMWCRRYGARKSASLSSWRRKIAKLPASSSTRRLNSSCARTRAATASGCVKSVPGFQHRAHMHVRLRCPAGSLECEDQAPPPPGDGCGAELQSWFEPPKPGSTPCEEDAAAAAAFLPRYWMSMCCNG